MKLKIVMVRAKDGKRIEKEDEYSTLEKVKFTLNIFYPKQYKAYAVYDGDKLLYSRGFEDDIYKET